ncbi:MAG TPA: fibronectin type III domain-containing protein, partial [Anaerolineae bacterium]|nr:fibronectin type III domain-containing protein [Anaerolineae bacterium]
MRLRTSVLIGALIGWLLAWSLVEAQGPKLTRGPYLQSTTRDSVIVVWQTDLAGGSIVEYGETGYTEVISDTAPVATHALRVTGLAAGTTYMYRVSTGGAVLHEATLATAPDPGGAFDFTVIGDSGTGSRAQGDVAAQMLALDPDFILHTGDVIYPDGQAAGYDPRFFTPYRDLLDGRPVFPSLGNHDYRTAGAQ